MRTAKNAALDFVQCMKSASGQSAVQFFEGYGDGYGYGYGYG